MSYRTYAAVSFATFLTALSPTGIVRAEDKAAATGEFSRATVDVGIVVRDVAKSVKFYTEAIGMSEQPGFKVPADYGGEVGLTGGTEGLDVRVVAADDTPGATKLKLMQFGSAPKAGATETIDSQLGYRYLTIFITDTTAAVERLKKYGAKPLAHSPKQLPKGMPQDIYLTVVRDPDGNIVELVGPKK